MKTTALFLAVTIACAMSMQSSSQGKLSMKSAMTQLKNNKWGQVATDFLELSLAVNSPMTDLLQAFQDFFHDISFKIEIETFDFNVKEAEHDEWEAAIRDRIASAEADIAQATHSLDNVLYPLKAELEEALRRDRQLIVDTNAAMAAATEARNAEHAANVQYVEEALAAVDALNDCLDLLAELDSGAASLIQMTKINRAFKKLEKTMKNNKFGNTVLALIKIMDFANPEMLERLRGKFTEVKNSLLNSVEETQARDAAEQAAYEDFMARSQQDIDDANDRIVANTAALEACNQEIADTEAFRAQRQADLAVAEQDLEDELARWANEVALFEKMMGEMQNEVDAINEVIDVLVSINVSEETVARINV